MPRLLLATLLLASLSPLAGAVYSNKDYGFTVNGPSGWKQLSYPGTLVVFAQAPSGGFSTNINVVAEQVPAGFTLRQYQAAGMAQLKKAITDLKMIAVRPTTLGGVPAMEQTFTGRQGQYSLYFSQTFAVKGGRAFVVTGTSLQNLRAGLTPAMSGFVKSFAFRR